MIYTRRVDLKAAKPELPNYIYYIVEKMPETYLTNLATFYSIHPIPVEFLL